MSDDVIIVMMGIDMGFLSGLFGVGGSRMATPLLRLMHVPRLVALASPLPVTVPTALVGGFTYWRRGLVKGRLVLWTAAGGLPAVVVGSSWTAGVSGRVLMALTGLVVFVVGLRVLRPSVAGAALGSRAPTSAGFLIGVGGSVGLLSGLLANGGGYSCRCL